MGLLLTLLVALPWVLVPLVRDPFLLPKTMVWFVGSLALAIHLLSPPYQQLIRFGNRWAKWVLWMVVVPTAIRFWWTMIVHPESDVQIPFNWFCVLPSIYICLGLFLAMLLATSVFPVFANQVRVSQWLCVIAVSVAIYSLIQYVGLDQFTYGPHVTNVYLYHRMPVSPEYMVTLLGNPSYTSMYLALHVPLFLMFQSRRYLVYLAIVLLAILLMRRLYGVGVSCLEVAVYVWLRRFHASRQKRHVALLGVAGVVVALVAGWRIVVPNYLHDERLVIWQQVWLEWQRQGITGYGIGAFPIRFFVNWTTSSMSLSHEYATSLSRWLWAHNDALQWLYEAGLMGTVPVALMIISTFRRAWRRTTSVIGSGYFAALCGVVLMSLMNFPWHFAPTALVCLVIWAMNETQEVAP